MANPNIVNVTSIYGKTAISNLGTSASDALINTAASGKVYKINSILAANKHGTSAADVSVWLLEGSTIGYIASTVSVPADSTLVLLDKTSAIYVTEAQSIKALASLASSIDLIISYEDIS